LLSMTYEFGGYTWRNESDLGKAAVLYVRVKFMEQTTTFKL